MVSPISPAPSTRVVFPDSDPSSATASATAACESDVVPRAMAVSDRTRLPTSRAWRNNVDSTGPAADSTRAVCQASPTWPRISLSPSTAESNPAATLNRWAAAASSKYEYSWSENASGGTPPQSEKKLRISLMAAWKRSATA